LQILVGFFGALRDRGAAGQHWELKVPFPTQHHNHSRFTILIRPSTSKTRRARYMVENFLRISLCGRCARPLPLVRIAQNLLPTRRIHHACASTPVLARGFACSATVAPGAVRCFVPNRRQLANVPVLRRFFMAYSPRGSWLPSRATMACHTSLYRFDNDGLRRRHTVGVEPRRQQLRDMLRRPPRFPPQGSREELSCVSPPASHRGQQSPRQSDAPSRRPAP